MQLNQIAKQRAEGSNDSEAYSSASRFSSLRKPRDSERFREADPVAAPLREAAPTRRRKRPRIKSSFLDIGEETESTVTFEAENNLDFRLGTGRLRGTRLAQRDDIAAISRVGDSDYQLRLYRQDSAIWRALDSYAIHFIGNRGKRYGFISNQEFETVANVERGELTPGR